MSTVYEIPESMRELTRLVYAGFQRIHDQIAKGELPTDFGLDEDDGWEYVNWAINHKKWSSIQFLVRHGYDLSNSWNGRNTFPIPHLIDRICDCHEEARFLLALGADPHFSHVVEDDGIFTVESAMQKALTCVRNRPEGARLLIANANIDLSQFRGVPRWLTAFQRHVRRIRSCAIVLIGIRFCKKALLHWDRFLICEVALELWRSREEY